MKRLMTAVCCALAAGTVAAAQTSSMDKGKMDKDMKGKSMMVTGCVAEGSGGHYMLTNAMMSDDMKGGMKGDMKGDMKPMSFDLKGGDLKAHVGHKVEVTGMMSGKMMGKDKMMDKDKMDKDKMGMSDAHGTLQVKSVKMIAATCP